MAQLELSVVLNLANFRTQLGKLAQASAAYYYPINLTIDKQAFKKQLAALGNIKPVIKIEDSQLDGARARIATLNKSLATLRRATSTAIEIKVKYKEEGRPAAGTGAVGRAITGRAAGEEALANKSRGELQKLYGLFREANLRVGELSKSLGKSSAEEIRQSLVPAFSDSGEEAVNGLAIGLKDPSSKVSKAAKRLTVITIQDVKKGFGIASPSRVFKEIGKDLVAGLEIGFEDFNELRAKMVGKMRELVAVMRMEAAKIQDIPMTPGMSRSAGSRGSRQYMSPIGPLPEGSQEPWAFSQYRYQPFMAQPGQTRGAGVPPMRQRFPFLPEPPVMGTTVSSPGMYGASFPALPPAGGTAATRETMLAMRELEARVRSAARAASVFAEDMVSAGRRNVLPPAGGGSGTAIVPHRSFVGPTSRQAIPMGAGGGALVPYAGGGGNVPPGPPPGGGGGGGGGSFGGGGFNVPNLPGAGLVREIGTEFGFAAKQVLLFGTAYKALAFIQGFPAQVGDAVGALQSFRNTLGAISPSAEEAAASSQFILDVVDKYNTPIQSARDGFTKLYASMKPTGFSGDEIRDLFLGISQAAATFGMSADKVDRVNYAFAQMASKGQVMSEELKGQLGDVLPGAMGIFAEAAGFEGPDAITKFSKALEDGAYKGAAMKTLLVNVTSIMQKEFGPGAEGAARTFQGVMNRMQNSTKLLYEAFEPVAVGFLNSVVMPLTSGLKTVTDGFNAFFTGTNAKTAGGFAFAQELEKLRPTFEGLRTNAIALAQVFGEFAKVALSVGSALLQIAGNPIVGFMAKIYAIMVPLNMALGVMRGLWALNSLQLLLFNARVAMGVPTLSAFRGMMQATGATAAVTATSIRTAGLTLRTFFASTGVGLILVGISLLIERFMSMNQALADTRAKALGAAQAIRSMTKTEAILDERKTVSAIKLLETLQTRKRSYEGSTDVSLTKSEASLLEDVGVPVNKGGVGGGQYMDPTMLESHKQRLETVNLAELRNRQRVIKNDENKAKQTAAIAPITGGDGDAGAGGKDKGADDAKRLREEIARQAAAASDALFAEQQRFLILQQTNPIAEAIAKYTSEEASIQRELNAGLKEAQSEKEKIDLKEAARLQGAANRLELEQSINDEAEKALKPITDLLASQREELALTTETEKLMKEGISPERAKQIAQVRLLVKQQLEALDLSIDQADAAITEAKARGASVKAVEDLIAALDRLKEKRREGEEQGKAGEEGVPKDKPKDYLGDALTSAEARLKELLNPAYQLAEAAKTIGDSFGEAFKGIITGSMTAQEALAGLFQSIADHFADMVAQMIAEYLKMQLIKGILSLLNIFAPGGDPGGKAVGTGQGIFTAANGGIATGGFRAFANGGIAPGGFTAFANGGIVTGPTLGLVGEGRYNEAVIPLPDGKSVPVDLGGMAGGMGGEVTSNIVVNINNGQMQGNGNSNGSELGRKIEGAVKQVLVSELRPGGILSSGRR
jgi:tape measure domain-containing protein